jgi:hypothetical protein
MANNIPLIFDQQDNRIKELPIGNNLDLAGSGISNLNSLNVNGPVTVNSITIDNKTLGNVAFTNNYEDLDNTPTGFTGDYNDLINRPSIPNLLSDLEDVSDDAPIDGSALVFNEEKGSYEPSLVVKPADLNALTLDNLSNVITQGAIVTNRFLKFTGGAWRPSRVQYAELQDKPTAVSAFDNDLGYLTQQDLESGIEITPTGDLTGSVFADDSKLLVDGVSGTVPGTLTGDWINPEGTFSVLADSIGINAGNSVVSITNSGIAITQNAAGNSSSVGISNGSFSVATTNQISMASNGFSLSAGADLISMAAQEFVLTASNITISNSHVDADLKGSVFGDESTLLVDGVNGLLPYTAKETDNWAGDPPTDVYEALDRIAAALTALGQQA